MNWELLHTIYFLSCKALGQCQAARGVKRGEISSTCLPPAMLMENGKFSKLAQNIGPPLRSYLSPVCNVSKRGGESFSLLSEARLQQNAKPDLEHLEQLKQFLFLVNAAINWEFIRGSLFFPRKPPPQDIIYSRRTSLLLTGKCWDEVSDSCWLS